MLLTYLLKVYLCDGGGQLLLESENLDNLIDATKCVRYVSEPGVPALQPRLHLWSSDLLWERRRTKLRIISSSWRIHRAANQQANIPVVEFSKQILKHKSHSFSFCIRAGNISLLLWKWESEMFKQPDQRGRELASQCLSFLILLAYPPYPCRQKAKLY